MTCDITFRTYYNLAICMKQPQHVWKLRKVAMVTILPTAFIRKSTVYFQQLGLAHNMYMAIYRDKHFQSVLFYISKLLAAWSWIQISLIYHLL